MLKSNESNKKSLEELENIYEQALLTYKESISNDGIEKEEDEKLIEKIKEVYNIEDENYKIVSMPQFIFAKRFRTILKDRKLKGKKAVEELDLKKETISRYRNGDEYPSIDTILKIAKRLKISPYYLLGLSNYMTLETDEINRILGLSEKSMKFLFMLNHNVEECEEITDKVPISNENKGKIDILNRFIENNIDFIEFLSCLEKYAKINEKMKQTKNKRLREQLLRFKRRVDKHIVELFKKIVKKERKRKIECSNICKI